MTISSVMSSWKNRFDPEMSPGRVNPGSEAMAAFAARPSPVSTMPPCQTATPCAAARSWIFFASMKPPTPPGLMLITEVAPSIGGRLGGDDRLIEAHRGVHELREFRVLSYIGLTERLFDEQQTIVVESSQVGGVDEGVGGIRIDLESEVVAEGPAHRRDRLDVLAGLDLEFDPGVALFEVAAD